MAAAESRTENWWVLFMLLRGRWLQLLVLGLFLSLQSQSASAATKLTQADCSTPYRAVYTWLEWLQPDRFDPEIAATCFDLNINGLTRKAALRRVVELKEVTDARGWWIPLEDFPDEPTYVDAVSGDAHYQVLEEVAEVYVRKVGRKWRFSKAALEITPTLYDQTFSYSLQSIIDNIPSWLRWNFLGLAGWQYIGLLVLLLLSLPIGRLIGWLLAQLVSRGFRRIKFSWGEAVVNRILEPMRLLGGAGIVWLLLPQLRLAIKVNLVLLVAVKVFAAYSCVWAVYRAVDVFAEFLGRRAEATDTRLDDQLVPLVRKSMKILTVVVGILFILQNLNVDVQSLIAGLGIGGLAFALAAKDTLANLFGSLTIFLDRPFQIGDWVLLGGVEGVVESVGFRSTRIRTFSNSLVTMPNAQVADSVIDNMGAREFRRVKALFNLTYDTTPEQMQAFVEGIRAILRASPQVRQDFYEVYFVNFGAHSLDVLLYAFFKVPNWSEELKAKHNLFLEVMRLARELDVDFAFPTQTLHLDSMAQAKAMGDRIRPTSEKLAQSVDAFGPGGSLSQPEGKELTDGYFAAAETFRGSSSDG